MDESGSSNASRKRPQSPSFLAPPPKRDAPGSSPTAQAEAERPASEKQPFMQFFVEAPDLVMQCRRTLVLRKPADASVQSVVNHLLNMGSSLDMGIPRKFSEYIRLTRRNGRALTSTQSLESAGVTEGITLYIDGTIPKNVLLIQQEMDRLMSLADEMDGLMAKESADGGAESEELGMLKPLSRFAISSRKFLKSEAGSDGFCFSSAVVKIFLAEGGLQVLTSVSRYEEPRGEKAGRVAALQFVDELATECEERPSTERLGHYGAAIVLAMIEKWSQPCDDATLQSDPSASSLLAVFSQPISRALTFLFKDQADPPLTSWFNKTYEELRTRLWNSLTCHLSSFDSGHKTPNLLVPHLCSGLKLLFKQAGSPEASDNQAGFQRLDRGEVMFWGEVYEKVRARTGLAIMKKLPSKGGLQVAPPGLKKSICALLSLTETLTPLETLPSEAWAPLESFRSWLAWGVNRAAINTLLSTNSIAFAGFLEMPWLLKAPYRELLTMDTKRKWLEYNLPNTVGGEAQVEITVDRKNLLADAFDKLAYENAEELRGGGIYPTFVEEEGYGPGVRREFFTAVARELFDPSPALFIASPLDRRRVFPNQASDCNPGHLAYFRFCGRFLALALAHRVQLGVALASAFFRLLCNTDGGVGDVSDELERLDEVADVDRDTWRSCKQLLEMSAEEVDSLGLSFVCCIEKLGTQTEIPLFPGGEDRAVTATTLRHFLGLKLRRQLYEPVRCQVTAVREGFQEMITRTGVSVTDVLEPVGEKDFALVLQGDPADVSLADWKAHTSYHEYAPTDAQITWFWQALDSFPQERRRQLLFFATSVKYLPPTGFTGLPDRFHIFRGGDELELLPTSHTCFLQLVLPPYDSYKMMRQRLMIISDAQVAESYGMA